MTQDNTNTTTYYPFALWTKDFNDTSYVTPCPAFPPRTTHKERRAKQHRKDKLSFLVNLVIFNSET